MSRFKQDHKLLEHECHFSSANRAGLSLPGDGGLSRVSCPNFIGGLDSFRYWDLP